MGTVVKDVERRVRPETGGKEIRTRQRLAHALAALLAGWAVASAAPTVEEILANLWADRATYQGVRNVHFYGPRGSFVVRQKVFHTPGGRERFEVVSPPSMAGKLHVSDGQRAWLYDPRQQQATEMPLPPHIRRQCGRSGAEPKTRPPWMGGSANRWRQRGTATVAGRTCYVVEFLWPANTPTLVLYVDSAQFVPLAFERRTPDGRIVESWKFESIEFVQTLDPKLFAFAPPPGTKVIRPGPPAEPIALSDVFKKLRMKPVIPSWLPPGYRLVEERVAVVRKRNREVLWLQFSNGVDTFSVFQSFRLPPARHRHPGAVRWEYGPYTLVVVGKLSREQLEAMRKSLREWSGR